MKDADRQTQSMVWIEEQKLDQQTKKEDRRTQNMDRRTKKGIDGQTKLDRMTRSWIDSRNGSKSPD